MWAIQSLTTRRSATSRRSSPETTPPESTAAPFSGTTGGHPGWCSSTSTGSSRGFDVAAFVNPGENHYEELIERIEEKGIMFVKRAS